MQARGLVVRSGATLFWFRTIRRWRFWLSVLVLLLLALRAGSGATGATEATGIIVRIHRVSIVQVSIRISFIIRIVGHLIWKCWGNFVVVILLRRLVGVEGGAAGGGGVSTRVYGRSSVRCPLGGESA